MSLVLALSAGLALAICHIAYCKSRRGLLHTSELDDGYDWNRLNLKSVTEENTLDEFLATAELAGTEFTAEKLNVKFVSAESSAGLLSKEEEEKVSSIQGEHKELLKVPRRPYWDEFTTASELDRRERDAFLEWRRQLAELQDVEGLVLTPFEKNLDFWRQLWRVIERSDIVVQIVDARNPLLFRCEDLESYVKEVNPNKVNMVLINKADYLSEQQRQMWADYFDNLGLRVAFWSAVLQEEKNKASEANAREMQCSEEADEEEEEDEEEEDGEEEVENSSCVEEEVMLRSDEQDLRTGSDDEQPEAECESTPRGASGDDHIAASGIENLSLTDGTEVDSDSASKDKEAACSCVQSHTSETGDNPKSARTDECQAEKFSSVMNSVEMVDTDGLISLLKSLHKGEKHTPGITTVGLVGYPNVGKSSTINAILQTKKVAVSATPGKTKHFQTLFVDPELMLCDCPGLVMPTFVSTKAHMVLNGILPVDQMRDYVAPAALLCKQIGRAVLEGTYGILLPQPMEGEDEDRPPTAHEFLGAHACMRGFMTHKGIPDFRRSAVHVLKDYVNGKLVYCQPPPGVTDEEFSAVRVPVKFSAKVTKAQENMHSQNPKGRPNEFDKRFFQKKEVRVGSKGVQGVVGYTRRQGFTGHCSTESDASTPYSSMASVAGKPWKKHNNRKKKEKLRRLHRDLDA